MTLLCRPMPAIRTALYLGLRELKEDLMEHILLENTILFVPPVTTADKDTVCCGSCG